MSKIIPAYIGDDERIIVAVGVAGKSGYLHLYVDGQDDEGRFIYQYSIFDQDMNLIERSIDEEFTRAIRTGVGLDDGAKRAAVSLISFLLAEAESANSRTVTTDPPKFTFAVSSWAVTNADELATVQFELDEVYQTY